MQTFLSLSLSFSLRLSLSLSLSVYLCLSVCLSVSVSLTNTIFGKDQRLPCSDWIYFISDPERVTHALYPADSAYYYVDACVSPCFSPSHADMLSVFPDNRAGFEQLVLLAFVLTFNTLCKGTTK